MVKGIKIKLRDVQLIRRLGGSIIHADPSVARRYVDKGLADYVDRLIETPIEILEEKIRQKEEKVEVTKVNNKIFPKEIIND